MLLLEKAKGKSNLAILSIETAKGTYTNCINKIVLDSAKLAALRYYCEREPILDRSKL